MQSVATEADVDAAGASDIHNLLSGAGEVVALKALCSLGAGGDAMAGDVVAIALDRIEHELVSMNRTFPRSATTGYLCSRLVALLVRGVFRIADDDARGLAENVAAMVSGKPGSAADLLRRLGPGWGADNARDGLLRRLPKLVLDRTLRAKLKQHDRSGIDRIASTYFLIDAPGDVREEVVGQVVALLALGGHPWTH